MSRVGPHLLMPRCKVERRIHFKTLLCRNDDLAGNPGLGSLSFAEGLAEFERLQFQRFLAGKVTNPAGVASTESSIPLRRVLV